MPAPVQFPSDRSHLASLLDDFRRHGSQTAVVTREGLRRRSWSYSGLADLAGRFAAELNARDIRKGDRVLIWGANGGEWIASFFGCILLGVIAVPIDVAGTVSFAERVRNEVGAKLITGSRDQLRLLDGPTPKIAFEDFGEQLRHPAIERPADGLSENDALQIVFTSGTTGEPKGVVHTHRNILASLRPIEREMQKYLKYERIFHPLGFLHTLPLSHVFGQFMGIWIPALLAAEVYFESRMIPGDLIQTIHDEHISALATVPRALEILERHVRDRFPNLDVRLPQAAKLSALRRWWMFRDVHRALGLKFWALICGGATLPAEAERFWNRLGLVVIQGYGMTETGALVSLNHPFHAAQGSIGKVLPGREIRLGEDGEILVRGETVSQSSWEGGQIQQRASEWLATGDLASVDAAGNLTFKGRKKEVIVTAAGLNIYPDDLEAALLRQPQVAAAAVVEAAGPNGSEPVAALVLRDSADPGEAVRAANQELAEYQQIRRWVIWPDADLPRTSTGKIRRGEIAAALRTTPGQPGVIQSSGGALETLIGRITGENVAHVSDSALLSEDLRLDSLGRVELQAALESQYGAQLDDSRYRQVRTLGELKGLITPAAAPPSQREEHTYSLWPWSRLQSAIRIAFIELVMRPLVAILGKPLVQRDFTDDELSPPVLIVSNHVTAFDVPLILHALPGPVRRRVAVAMAGEMLLDWRKARAQGNPFLNVLAPLEYLLVTALFNVFPLPQQGNFRKSFAHAGRAMDRGFHVMVFPEGRRSSDGLMHSFQSGAGLLWKDLQARALPVYLGGLGELKAESKWLRSGRLSIRIGQPIPYNADVDVQQATRILEQAVRDLAIMDG